MPMFDFECNKCGKIIEKIVSHSNKDVPINCDCSKDASLSRVEKIGKTNIAFKGKWFKNTGSY